MRIENLNVEKGNGRVRAGATVIWEDCDRPTRAVFFETDEALAPDLWCDPHAFLVSCVLPALRHGEKRIAIAEEICPELRNGLMTAMSWICHWQGPPRTPVCIEAKPGFRASLPHPAERAGSFLSGGVDSLSLLRRNRLDFPHDHPRSIKDCLVVHGFDIGGIAGCDPERDTFERAVASLSAAAEDAQVTLLPITTNIRHIDDNLDFWMNAFVGAAIASVAHALSCRFSTVFTASNFDIPNWEAGGSNILLDPNYSSANLQIRHEGLRFSRLDKVRLISEWQVALQHLRVCTMNPPGLLNCGVCEKCVRTMLELLAVGRLVHTRAFPASDVSPELLETVTITVQYQESWYAELLSPLAAAGRLDLVRIIEKKIADFHKHLAWVEEKDWKGAVKRFDRRYLGASLFKSYKTVRAQVKRT